MPNVLIDAANKHRFLDKYAEWMKTKRPKDAIGYFFAMPTEGPPVGYQISFFNVPDQFCRTLLDQGIPFNICNE
jgi:hypothetical protein